MSRQTLKYVLVTPARNEAEFIGGTIESVIAQTVRPVKWVIVSDGSTDRTDEVVKKYLDANPWIELVRRPERRERHFGGKVRCFNSGYEKVRNEEYDVIGNVDADITFTADHFEYLLEQFAARPKLGVAGTPFVEGNNSYDFRFTTVEHVSGACQLFRRECFNEIGGYMEVKGGGIDWIAVTTARMKGWETRTFVERVCHHHRPMGTASVGKLRACISLGRQDYYLGGHPLWQLFRAFYQMGRKPYVVGGLLLFLGYCGAWISGERRPVSQELMRFHRREQMRRLRQSFFRVSRPGVAKQVSG
jgi:glycosyltransferase involved in cell wall biosynthesis